MVLSFTWDGKCSEGLRVVIQLHLPETRSQIEGRKDGGVCPANVANTFCDLLHAVLVDVGVIVQLPEILYNSETLSLFFGHTKSGEF